MKCITNLDGVEYADENESPDMVPAKHCSKIGKIDSS